MTCYSFPPMRGVGWWEFYLTVFPVKENTFKRRANLTQFPGSRFRNHMRRWWWRAYVVRERWLWRQFDTISGHGLNHTPALNDPHRSTTLHSSNIIAFKSRTNGISQRCQLKIGRLSLLGQLSVTTATTKTRNY